MASTSTMLLPLGAKAPAFSLPSIDGDTVTLHEQPPATAVLVVFLSNHCPYVRHVEQALGALTREFQDRGLRAYGIGSNDSFAYPEDGPEGMAEQKARAGWPFPYLVDESQEVAQAYRAACTPDFFLFDGDLALVYRGQMDDTRPRQGREATGADLRAAVEAVLAGRPVSEDQQPSVGCGLKWKPGNEPK